jgi:protein tyrosine phosphatase (PTP) superfamily phosphohydrolase (DUF442 family)
MSASLKRLLTTLAAAALCAAVAAVAPADEFPSVASDHLPNAHRITPKVISGGEPDRDAGFAEIARLGVRTIITVDGAKPDVERARRFGLRYVHLPIGYDGVSPEQGRTLAKAVAELPGPIYLHCHHGKHRSPAAAAVACVLAGQLEASKAADVLKTCGTGAEYKGLWAAARAARPASAGTLASLQVAFVETAKVPPVAEAMVEIDHTFERLKAAAAAGWRTPPNHPDVDPPHEALQLVEKLRELGRTQDVLAKRPETFRDLLGHGEREATALKEALVANKPAPTLDEALKTVTASCAACHKAYRD